MNIVDLKLYERGGIDTFEDESGETLFDLTALCDSFTIDVTAISMQLSGIRFGVRDGVEYMLVNEDGFFRAVFLIMEHQKKLYASEVLKSAN